ncbi:hypothetical protein BKH43_06475 [Helicobacter sp. 13S00401-1]|nr:hypothetical protein BKH43_06475 [Helicobacter sp. 13S00401-1]
MLETKKVMPSPYLPKKAFLKESPSCLQQPNLFLGSLRFHRLCGSEEGLNPFFLLKKTHK